MFQSKRATSGLAHKILFVDFITSFGGVQTVMANMIPELMQYHDVKYIDALGEKRTETVFELAKIPLVKLKIWPRRQYLRFEGSLIHKLIIFIIWAPVHFLYAIRLSYYASHNRFEILYSNSKKALFISMIAGQLAGRLPVVYHCHGLGSSEEVGWLYKLAMRRCRAIIAVSEDVKRKLILAEIPEKLIYVIYNGIDKDKLEAQASQVSAELRYISRISEPKCLIACNLQKAKGVHLAIEAIHILKDRGHRVHLFVAGTVPRGGDSRYKDHLLDMVQHFELQGLVHFVGWRTDLPALIKACDVILVPSVGWESFGMVAAEAMALGKPVIASNIGGLPEVVRDGRVGFIVELGNVEDLAGRILDIVSDVDLYANLSREARLWSDSHFSLKRQASEIADLIDGILNMVELSNYHKKDLK